MPQPSQNVLDLDPPGASRKARGPVKLAPVPNAVESLPRQILAERIAAVAAGESAVAEAERAAQAAFDAWAEAERELSAAQHGDGLPDDDSALIGMLAAPGFDGKAVDRSLDVRAAKLATLREALGRWEFAKDRARAEIPKRRESLSFAMFQRDAAAREVIAAEAPIAEIEKRVADLRAALAAELRRADVLRALAPHGSEAAARLAAVLNAPIPLGDVENSDEARAYRAAFSALQADAGAKF